MILVINFLEFAKKKNSYTKESFSVFQDCQIKNPGLSENT